MGGSSRLNYMMYVRGDPRDFDAWERAGNPGWGYENILPLFRQAESHYGRFKKDGMVFHKTCGNCC